MLNIKKFPKYFIGAAVLASSLILIKLLANHPPTASQAIHHQPSIATHIAELLPLESRPATPLSIPTPSAVINISPVVTTLVTAAPAKVQARSHQKYQIAIPINSSIARRYDQIALKTGYLEQYPEISPAEMTTYQGHRLAQDAATAFQKMQQAAAQEEIVLQMVSGFRSIRTQNEIFTGKGGGLTAAEYSAPPGHSQHHTGLAVDINSLSPKFRETAAFRWLSRHGSQYGFMLPYANTSGDLGPQAEPWHWVYVANRPAMQLMTNFVDRARQHQHNPFLGNQQLEKIYHSATDLTIQIPNKSKS